MTTKKFTVFDTRTNGARTFDSMANTVGELKNELLNMGIDINGMAVSERFSHANIDVGNPSAALPTNVVKRDGSITNDLVFYITKAGKNIESGMDRKQAYAQIKDLNIQDKIKAAFGKSYTNVPTNDLENFLRDYNQSFCVCNHPVNDVNLAIVALVNTFVKKGCLKIDEGAAILALIGENINVEMDEEVFESMFC